MLRYTNLGSPSPMNSQYGRGLLDDDLEKGKARVSIVGGPHAASASVVRFKTGASSSKQQAKTDNNNNNTDYEGRTSAGGNESYLEKSVPGSRSSRAYRLLLPGNFRTWTHKQWAKYMCAAVSVFMLVVMLPLVVFVIGPEIAAQELKNANMEVCSVV